MNPNLLREADIARRADQRCSESYQIALAGIWAAIALIVGSILVTVAFVLQGARR